MTVSDTAGGLQTAVANALRQLAIDYEVLPCEPSLADTAVFCEHYGIDPRHSANTLLLRGKTGEARYAACVVLAHTRVDVSADLRRRLGARRVSFASAEETLELTGMEIGGVTPPGLPDSLPVWVDSRVMQLPSIVLGGGNRRSKLRASPALFEAMPHAEVIDGLAKEAAPPSN